MSEAASAELEAAVSWYEAQRPGLGAELFDAVNHVLDLVESNPHAGARISADARTRRFIVLRFPYQVVYRVCPDEIVIVAVAHLKRRPGYWKHRDRS